MKKICTNNLEYKNRFPNSTCNEILRIYTILIVFSADILLFHNRFITLLNLILLYEITNFAFTWMPKIKVININYMIF